jgi:hypothetical protein
MMRMSKSVAYLAFVHGIFIFIFDKLRGHICCNYVDKLRGDVKNNI